MNIKNILNFVFFTPQEEFIKKIYSMQNNEAKMVFEHLQNQISFVIENNLSNSVTLTNLNIFYNFFATKKENNHLLTSFIEVLLNKKNILFFKNSQNSHVFGKLKEDIYNFILSNSSDDDNINIFTEKVILDIINNKLPIKDKKKFISFCNKNLIAYGIFNGFFQAQDFITSENSLLNIQLTKYFLNKEISLSDNEKKTII